MKADKRIPLKRPPRPPGRDLPRQNVLRFAWGIALWEPLYKITESMDHLPDRNDDDTIWSAAPGRKPELPPEAYAIFLGVWARMLSDRDVQGFLQDPVVWEPIRKELYRRFPQYRRLAPGGAGPSRSMFSRWAAKVAEEHLGELRECFEEAAAHQALSMGMYDPDRRDITHPHIADQFIVDGTIGTAMFDAVEGDLQHNRETGLDEQKPYDSDAKVQHRKTDGETESSDAAGIHHGLLHGTTGHVQEEVLLTTFHVPGGEDENEAALAIEKMILFKETYLPGAEGGMSDKAMRGLHIDALYSHGMQGHAKVSAAKGGKPKETLIQMAEITNGGATIGTLPLVGFDGAAHLRVNIGGRNELVRLEPGQTRPRQNKTSRNRAYRWWKDYTVPYDPRIPARMRGGTVSVRLDTTNEDRARGINRAENLRPIARGDKDWATVGGPRSRAESVNSLLKRKWPNKRIPAVGARRQQLRIIGFGLALNYLAAVAYENRTGIKITGPPGDLTDVA